MRDLINMVEKTLYRGDSSNIEKFQYEKTDKDGLFGRGIYLTDQPEIAKDYTFKGSTTVFRTDSAKNERDVVAQYLRKLIIDKYGYAQEVVAARDKLRNEFFALDAEQRDAMQPDFQKRGASLTTDVVNRLLVKAKAQYKSEKADLRIGKDTLGLWYIVKSDHAAHVATFEVPDSVIARCLHAERPMSDEVVEFFGTIFDPLGEIDMRDSRNNYCSYRDWLKAYNGRGITYAWSDGAFRRGPGNPSFDTLRNGTHFGHWWFRDEANADRVRDGLIGLGYLGLEYDGGTRVGAHVRGLGGMRHQCFVFWDDDLVHSFERSNAEHSLDSIPDAAAQRISASQKLFRDMNER